MADNTRFGSKGYNFKWNFSNSMIIQRKGFNKELNKYLADLIADYSEEFVPYHEGDLSHYVQTFGAKDHGTVTYQMEYAGPQYVGHWVDRRTGKTVYVNEKRRDRRFHPLATSAWTKQAWTTYGTQITQMIDKRRKEMSTP